MTRPQLSAEDARAWIVYPKGPITWRPAPQDDGFDLIAGMVMEVDGDDAAKLDAIAGIRAILWANGLGLRDLAHRIAGDGAVPRKITWN